MTTSKTMFFHRSGRQRRQSKKTTMEWHKYRKSYRCGDRGLGDAIAFRGTRSPQCAFTCRRIAMTLPARSRSEEHTSELQSQFHLVCRLLLEKKKRKKLRLPAATEMIKH